MLSRQASDFFWGLGAWPKIFTVRSSSVQAFSSKLFISRVVASKLPFLNSLWFPVSASETPYNSIRPVTLFGWYCSLFMSHIKDCSSRGMDASKPELFLSFCPGQTINFSILVCYQICSSHHISENSNPGDQNDIADLREKIKKKIEEKYFTFL